MKRFLLLVVALLFSGLALAAVNINTASKDELDALRIWIVVGGAARDDVDAPAIELELAPVPKTTSSATRTDETVRNTQVKSEPPSTLMLAPVM